VAAAADEGDVPVLDALSESDIPEIIEQALDTVDEASSLVEGQTEE